MNKRKWRMGGFSLVELMVGFSITIFILVSFSSVFTQFTRANTSISSKAKASQRLRDAADQIRMEALSNFHTLSETGKDRTFASDPGIKITSTIGEINPNLNTRTVTLTATWKQGDKEQTLTSTFALSHVRGEMAGALVKVKVVKQGTQVGVSGVKVSAQGQTVPTIQVTTDADGVCTLYGVFQSVQGVRLTVDGSPVRHFFTDGGDPGPSPAFFKYFQTPETKAGITDQTYYDPPININAPSVIRGKVVDAATSLAVQGAKLYLVAKPGTQLIPLTLTGSDQDQYTNSAGEYEYTSVIPGNYWLYMFGNTQYASLGKPNDDYRIPDVGGHFVVPINQTVTRPDFVTAKKGSLRGHVRGVRWNSTTGQYEESTSVGANGLYFYVTSDASNVVELACYETSPGWFYSDHIFSHTESLGVEATYYFANSTAWLDHWTNATVNPYSWQEMINVVTDSNGDFVLSDFSPKVVDDDHDKISPYSKVQMNGRYTTTPAPLTPIIMRGPFSSPAMLLYRSFFGYVHFPGGYTGLVSDFDFDLRRIYANTDNDVTFHYLERSALGNVTGKIIWGPTGQSPGSYFPYAGYVQSKITYPGGGLGGVIIQSGDYASYSSNWSSSLTTISGSNNLFDMKGTYPYVYNALPPNLGDETTVLRFWPVTSGIPYNNASKTFGETVRGYEIWVSSITGQMEYRAVPEQDMDLASFAISCYDGATFKWSETVPITNQEFMSGAHTTQFQWVYSGSTTVKVLPGATVPNVVIEVPGSQSKSYKQYTISWTNPAGWSSCINKWSNCPTSANFWNYFDAPSYGGSDLSLARKATTGKIYGRVVDVGTGQPVLGAVVTLKRTGLPAASYPNLTYTTIANACGADGCTYQFVFDNVNFMMWSEKSLTLSLTAAGYGTPPNAQSYAVQGYAWRQDFFLSPPPPAPPVVGDL